MGFWSDFGRAIGGWAGSEARTAADVAQETLAAVGDAAESVAGPIGGEEVGQSVAAAMEAVENAVEGWRDAATANASNMAEAGGDIAGGVVDGAIQVYADATAFGPSVLTNVVVTPVSIVAAQGVDGGGMDQRQRRHRPDGGRRLAGGDASLSWS